MTIRSITLLSAQKRVEKERKEFLHAQRIRLANYKTLLHNNTAARELILEILDYTGFNAVTRTADNQLFMAEGRRQVGREIIDLLYAIDPLLYAELIKQRGKQDGRSNHDDTTGTADDNSADDDPADE
jgi:hypothetical protein